MHSVDSNTTRLPVELYRPIVAYLPESDLRTLCLVSRAMRAEAERRLYMKIAILISIYSPDKNRLKALARDPRKCSYVQIFDLIALEWATDELQDIISSALRAMVNLTALVISTTVHQTRLYEVLNACSAKLRLFRFHMSHLVCDDEMRTITTFLRSQTQIKEVSLAFRGSKFVGQSEENPPAHRFLPSLPRLKLFLTEPLPPVLCLTQNLVHLRIMGTTLFPRPVMSSFLKELSMLPLESICIPLTEGIAVDIVKKFPHLRYLGEFGVSTKEEVIDTCSSFRTLIAITIHITHDGSFSNEEAQQQILGPLRRIVPTMCIVEFIDSHTIRRWLYLKEGWTFQFQVASLWAQCEQLSDWYEEDGKYLNSKAAPPIDLY